MRAEEYVEYRNETYYVAGTRISLDSVVYQLRSGASPETILDNFPMLKTLENVYGAIAFYLGNRQQVDRYLEQQEEYLYELERNGTPPSAGFLNRIHARAYQTDCALLPPLIVE